MEAFSGKINILRLLEGADLRVPPQVPECDQPQMLEDIISLLYEK